MMQVQPITLRGHGLRLEPLTLAHEDGLRAAARVAPEALQSGGREEGRDGRSRFVWGERPGEHAAQVPHGQDAGRGIARQKFHPVEPAPAARKRQGTVGTGGVGHREVSREG